MEQRTKEHNAQQKKICFFSLKMWNPFIHG